MLDILARAAGKFLWDAVEKGVEKHDANERRRHYIEKAPERRELARKNADRRRACFEYYYKEIVDELKKEEPEASGFARETLEMYVKEKILANAEDWVESLTNQSRKEYKKSRLYDYLSRRTKIIQGFWTSTNGVYEPYAKAYYQFLKSGKANVIQKLKVLDMASKCKLPDDKMKCINKLVELAALPDPPYDPVGLSGEVVLSFGDSEKIKAKSLIHAELAIILTQWSGSNSIFFEAGEEEENSIQSEAMELAEEWESVEDEEDEEEEGAMRKLEEEERVNKMSNLLLKTLR